ncbi:hypothetical protein QBC44DRAFT_301646 [Cladorrhinum sp. PSN332]|nr:hypothetical protein QBC44DRAFT_301646 [Cladorrhinum sp. PSN332]
MPALVEKLRQKAHAEHRVRISAQSLGQEHRDILVRAINNVTSTEIALLTFAQIIDGLPIADVAFDKRSTGLWDGHPVDEHEELCPGVMEKAREVCPQWKLDMMSFKPELIRDFGSATPGSKVFANRLIELVAVAIHQLGALLFQLDFRMHQGDVDAAVQASPPPGPSWIPEGSWAEPEPQRPTLFYHTAYQFNDIYPEGAADMVGYWVEDRILGGVVVFERKAEKVGQDGNKNPDPPNIYLHPCRRKVTSRVTQITDEQQQSLIDFLLQSNPAPSSCPLPILVGVKNRKRFDAEVSIVKHLVCRDAWERKPLTREEHSVYIRQAEGALDYPGEVAIMINTNIRAGNPLPEELKRQILSGELDDQLGPDKDRLDLDKML